MVDKINNCGSPGLTLSDWLGIRKWRTPCPRPGSSADIGPQLGFCGYIIHGVGEYVLAVDQGTPAARIGLEPGDVILALNGCRLTCEEAWHQAMTRAVASDTKVTLKIRDGRTGGIAYRDSHVFFPVSPRTEMTYPRDTCYT